MVVSCLGETVKGNRRGLLSTKRKELWPYKFGSSESNVFFLRRPVSPTGWKVSAPRLCSRCCEGVQAAERRPAPRRGTRRETRKRNSQRPNTHGEGGQAIARHHEQTTFVGRLYDNTSKGATRGIQRPKASNLGYPYFYYGHTTGPCTLGNCCRKAV